MTQLVEVRGTGPLGETRNEPAEFPVRLRVWALVDGVRPLAWLAVRAALAVNQSGPAVCLPLEVEPAYKAVASKATVARRSLRGVVR